MIKRAPIELPPDVARRFLEDMRDFFAERNGIKRDEIASRQMRGRIAAPNLPHSTYRGMRCNHWLLSQVAEAYGPKHDDLHFSESHTLKSERR